MLYSMTKTILNFKFVPRWVIQLVDFVILTSSFAFSYFFIKHFEFIEIYRGHFFIYSGLFAVVSSVVFYLMRIHTGLIRYSNVKDIVRIFLAVLVSSFFYVIAEKLIIQQIFQIHSLAIGRVLFLNFFMASSLLVILRLAVKELFHFAKQIGSAKKQGVLIYGANPETILLKNAIESVQNNSFNVIGFLEKKHKNKNSYLEQKKIFHLKDLPVLKNKHQVEKLLLLNEDVRGTEEKAIIDQCLQIGIKVITVPPSAEWVSGKLNFNQIQELRVEDLLQRDPILLDKQNISEEIYNKRILVTGAAGSIGSELVRQILHFKPKVLILCDQAESFLYELQLEIKDKFPEAVIVPFIGNVQNYKRMEVLFREHQPQMVFHAAAYKHVPLMEDNPSEAILANVLGTKNIAELSLIFRSEKFVMVSTDKAVNPTNVMGASKRIAEMYVQSLKKIPQELFEGKKFPNALLKYIQNSKTAFITTRFGNVLGSNGSVLNRFRSQIQKGGPVTVTHPEITRYFMTIPEAVQLVLEAATMGKGGEIYVFDMGAPVKILDLATQMIRLAGLEPDKDIKIEFSGLRAGEKLYEELLNDKETTLPTHHEKIKIANVIAKSYDQVLYDIEELIGLCESNDSMQIVRKMKEIVLEFESNNSQFEYLDKMKGIAYLKKIKLNENLLN